MAFRDEDRDVLEPLVLAEHPIERPGEHANIRYQMAADPSIRSGQ